MNDVDIDIDNIYVREESIQTFKKMMTDYENNKNNLSHEKGIYIYGKSGIGKTQFVLKHLKEMNYDIIYYDAGDIRNKNIVETITKRNMSGYNVMSLFKKEKKRLAIVMDEIDGMNNGDKGGLTALIKIIRAKKTKKQKSEETTQNPIICIGNYHTDKKIKELMNVCKTLELKLPTDDEIYNILNKLLIDVKSITISQLVQYIQKDLRKLKLVYSLYKHQPTFFEGDSIENILSIKQYNEDTKHITKQLITTKMKFSQHTTLLNENDRTTVGLLWHENIIDVISKIPKEKSIPMYIEILNNICFGDFIDRITFQKQIWEFNEMSSLIKTFRTNYILFNNDYQKKSLNEIRFTKILTKYSTEYNNIVFIHSLCQLMDLDKKDIFSFFHKLINHENEEIIQMLEEKYEMSKLDISRMCKYLSRYVKEHNDI